MKTLFYECFAGISGDMNLGALIDLGADVDHLRHELTKLGLDKFFKLNVSRGHKNGIYGTKVDVILTEQHHEHGAHNHIHDHYHEHDDHHDVHSHSHGEHHHDNARNYKQIVDLINAAALSPVVKRDSIAIFEIVARAEAKIHGVDYKDVHFHEVGAIDSIIDIVGAAICMNNLNADQIVTSEIEIGSGFVNCAHGKLPIPAPATAEILLGLTTKQSVVGYEMTTPTGAAIIKYYKRNKPCPNVKTAQKIGYGLGTHNLLIPNLLRVSLLKPDSELSEQLLIETNIDDLSPEKLAFAEQKLFEMGARDVFRTPIVMKKGRLGSKLSVLVDATRQQQTLDTIFKHTSAIGARIINIEKVALARKTISITTKYGVVRVKIALRDDIVFNYKAEHDDCVEIAEKYNLSLTELDAIINNALRKQGLVQC